GDWSSDVCSSDLRELERHDVTARAGRGRLPGRAAVRRAVDDAFLAGDPGRARVDAGDGQEGALGAGVLAVPGLTGVAGVEDAAELADHPALALVREAGREEALTDFAQRHGRRLRNGDGHEQRGERTDDPIHVVVLRE